MVDDLDIDLGLQPTPTVLVARNPFATDGQRTTLAARFFDHGSARSWIEKAEQAGRNLYVVRNALQEGILYRRRADGSRYPSGRWGNPPLIEDIRQIEWLVIDIDPRIPKFDRAQQHAIDLLGRLPVPLNYRMFSGRGIQAAVRLKSPATRRQSEAYSAALALAGRINAWLRANADQAIVQVDDVSNVNRFSRLCGTINQKTGERSRWIDSPSEESVIADPSVLLPEIRVPAKLDVLSTVAAPGVDGHLRDVLREIGREPNDTELLLLQQIGAGDDGEHLSHEFAFRAANGCDWAGVVLSDRSARPLSFASAAVRAGEPVGAIVAALLDPKNETLNEHWLRPKGTRPDALRVAHRALAKAIMHAGIADPTSGGWDDFA
jgi:hypothetical protein